MLIESTSKFYLKKIRAKAKMYEYGVPEEIHINVEDQAHDLIILCIAIVGDVSNVILDTTTTPVIIPTKYQEELYFASRFFDSYFHSQLNNEFNSYYILMGAVTYYFANMNGSAKVMLNHLSDSERFDFLASGLEKVIIWLLDSNQTFDFNEIDYRYREYVHLKKIKT